MTAPAAILPNEKELFALMATGDQVAFTKIFDHYEPRLYPFILKITRSEITAEEIVQELFIKLWIDRHKALDMVNPRSYIFRMAANRTANYLRDLARSTKLVRDVAGRMLVEKNTTEEAIDAKEMQEIINKVVELLPEQQKKVYKLSRQEGLTAEEIAIRMNISHKTVKNHLTEALHFIKDKLQHSPGAVIALIIFLMKNSR